MGSRKRLTNAGQDNAASDAPRPQKAMTSHGRAKSASQKEGNGPARGARRGTRGSAPWAARHAAKHAAEVAARNAAPPPPGSARATLRTPEAADELKAQIRALHGNLAGIERLQRDAQHTFYEIGLVLLEIRQARLYDAKGYSNFEAFLDREVALGRVRALAMLRIVETFRQEAAVSIGLDALLVALRSIDESTGQSVPHPLEPPLGTASRASGR